MKGSAGNLKAVGLVNFMKTLVMLPTYNESGNLENIAGRILSLKDTGIVIVDDNSPDGTGAIADRLAARNADRVFVLHRKERGRGTAGIAGLKKCVTLGADYIIEMDADFSHDPKYIPLFLEQMKDFDVVIGSRYVPGGVDSKRGVGRIVISKISRVIYKIGLRTRIKDLASGFKCYRRAVLEQIDLDHFLSNGFTISMELNHKIEKKGFRIKEYPIVFMKREAGESKLSVKDFLETLSLIVRLNFRRKD